VTARRAARARCVGGWLTITLLVAACGAQPAGAPPAAGPAMTALVGGRVQPSPEAATITDGVVLVSQGVITAVGSRSEIAPPPGPR
jgi:hypothetical protein